MMKRQTSHGGELKREIASDFRGLIAYLVVVIIFIALIVAYVMHVTEEAPAQSLVQDPISMCEDLMGQAAEHVEMDEHKRLLIWVGDGSEKYCYAFKHDDHWVVSGE